MDAAALLLLAAAIGAVAYGLRRQRPGLSADQRAARAAAVREYRTRATACPKCSRVAKVARGDTEECLACGEVFRTCSVDELLEVLNGG